MIRFRKETTIEEANEKCEKLGFVRLPMPKDGACLFRAISKALYETQSKHLEIRKNCVAFIKENRDDFEPFIMGHGLNCDTYLELMEKENEWGGSIEMQAMSRLMKLNFAIYAFANDKPSFVDNGFTKEINLWYSHGNHYDLLLTQKEMQKREFCQEIVYRIVSSSMKQVYKKTPYQNIETLLWEAFVEARKKRDFQKQKERQERIAEDDYNRDVMVAQKLCHIKMLNFPYFSNLVIMLDKKKFHVHTYILSIRCPKLLTLERKKGTLKLKEDEGAMTSFINYIYSDLVDFSNSSYSDVILLFKLANTYEVNRLQWLCENFIRKSLDEKTVFQILEIAFALQQNSIKELCYEFIRDNYENFADDPKLTKQLKPEIWQEVINVFYKSVTGSIKPPPIKPYVYSTYVSDFRMLLATIPEYEKYQDQMALIKVENVFVPVHTAILVAYCPKFADVFKKAIKIKDLPPHFVLPSIPSADPEDHNLRKSSHPFIHITEDIFISLLRFIYLGEEPYEEEHCLSLLHFAKVMGMDSLLQSCLNYLSVVEVKNKENSSFFQASNSPNPNISSSPTNSTHKDSALKTNDNSSPEPKNFTKAAPSPRGNATLDKSQDLPLTPDGFVDIPQNLAQKNSSSFLGQHRHDSLSQSEYNVEPKKKNEDAMKRSQSLSLMSKISFQTRKTRRDKTKSKDNQENDN